MQSDLPNIIKYFQQCYEMDNRSISIFNFLSAKVEHKVYFEQEELANGKYPIVPLLNEQGEALLKNVTLFEKEKELVYGSLFICGTYVDFKGRLQSLCAPLCYYDAEIIEKEAFLYAKIALSSRKLNHPLLQLFTSSLGNDNFKNELLAFLGEGALEFTQLPSVARTIEKFLPEIDCQSVFAYPKNLKVDQVKYRLRKLRKTRDTFQLVPFSVLGLVEKSKQTRGILNELKALGTSTNFSTPLRYLFQPDAFPLPKPKIVIEGYVPTILSQAQKNLVVSAAQNPVTLIVGPPGTGKTYTISAIALEHLSRGESVLIASRTNEAVDVVADKITTQLGFEHCIIRGGRRRRHLAKVRGFLRSLLLRQNTLRFLQRKFNEPNGFYSQSDLREFVLSQRFLLSKLKGGIWKQERDFYEALEAEKEKSHFLSTKEPKLWNDLRTLWLRLKTQLEGNDSLFQITRNLMENDHDVVTKTKAVLKWGYILNLLEVLEGHWKEFNEFYRALNAKNDTEKIKLFDKIDFGSILRAFPVWLINLQEIKDKVPLRQELFDVVIIDEATQCDIASCLPALQRAKRVVFAGDPNQLRHLSFLSGDVQQRLQRRFQLQAADPFLLDYRNNSILDIALDSLKSNNQVATLNEHYRSLPPIIGFSNTHFYEGELKVMTSKPDTKAQALYFVACHGTRSDKGFNTHEAEQLLGAVAHRIEEESDLQDALASSIGILSPFRSQADLLSKLVAERFGVETLKRHRLKIGTPYGFQGEERDLMYLSMVVDAKTHHSAFIHLNKPEVFNVAITRARHEQYVFVSIDTKEIPKNNMLGTYVAYGKQLLQPQRNKTSAVHDAFLKEVLEALDFDSFDNHWIGYRVAHITLDVLFKTGERYRAIDLIGYPGAYEHAIGIERLRILNRAGITVFPLSFADWYFDKEAVMENLMYFLQGTP